MEHGNGRSAQVARACVCIELREWPDRVNNPRRFCAGDICSVLVSYCPSLFHHKNTEHESRLKKHWSLLVIPTIHWPRITASLAPRRVPRSAVSGIAGVDLFGGAILRERTRKVAFLFERDAEVRV